MSEMLPAAERIYKGIARLFRGKHNVVTHNQKLERALRDHLIWLEDTDRSLRQELAELGSEFAARGTFHSGIRIGAQRRAREAALREWEQRRRDLQDLREDLVAQETWIETFHRRTIFLPTLSPSEDEARIVNSWREEVT